MNEEITEPLLASLAHDPECQAAVKEVLIGFAADIENLDTDLFTALDRCLRVIGVEVSLDHLLAELPYLHGLNDEPIDYQQYGLDLPDDVAEAIQQRLGEAMRPVQIDALSLHAQLPADWQSDPYWTRLCDVFRLYNAIVGAIGGLSHVACANLWDRLDRSLGGNWASSYLARILRPLVSQPALASEPVVEPQDSSDCVHEEMRAALGHALVDYPFADVATEVARMDRDREAHAEWTASRPPALEVLDGGAQASTQQDASDSAKLRLADRDTPTTDTYPADTLLTISNEDGRADTAQLEREDAPQLSAVALSPAVDDIDVRAESDSASMASMAARIRRYQWAIGTLCAAAVAILVAAGMMTHKAEQRAARAIEEARQLRDGPVEVDVSTPDGAIWHWQVEDDEPFQIDDYTFTLRRSSR